MKLQLKDPLSFQQAMGYCDDPEPMTEKECMKQFEYWAEMLHDGIECGTVPDELSYLESFLSYMAVEGSVEYENQMHVFEYTASFEYAKPIRVMACTKNEADIRAQMFFKNNRESIENDAKLAISYIYDSDGNEKYEEYAHD